MIAFLTLQNKQIMRNLLLPFMLTCCLLPNAMAQITTTIGTGTSVSSNFGPLYVGSLVTQPLSSRKQFVYLASDLAAAGINRGDTIKSLAWNKANSGVCYVPTKCWIDMKTSPTYKLFNGMWWSEVLVNVNRVFTDTAFIIPSTPGWVNF
jgi:hypothetical protein